MIKITGKHYKNIERSRRQWPKYATQLMNVASQNAKATNPKNVGSMKETWLAMRNQGIKGTLKNWTDFYNSVHGESRVVEAGLKIRSMLSKMGIEWIDSEMCIDYAKEVVYNKTQMGLGGEEMALEAVADYYGMEFRFSTAEEESKGIDGWIGQFPVQVKPHDSNFKAHVHNHADKDATLVVTYEAKKMSCFIHNPEFMNK